jgi:hypothetical protein
MLDLGVRGLAGPRHAAEAAVVVGDPGAAVGVDERPRRDVESLAVQG